MVEQFQGYTRKEKLEILEQVGQAALSLSPQLSKAQLPKIPNPLEVAQVVERTLDLLDIVDGDIKDPSNSQVVPNLLLTRDQLAHNLHQAQTGQ